MKNVMFLKIRHVFEIAKSPLLL